MGERHARSIADEALARPAAERPAWLDAACAGDAALRAEVEGLLADRLAAGVGPDEPTVSRAPAPPPGVEGPGSRIGRYRLLELIGEGGFGSVYLAEQREPVARKVALKIIKPGMDSRMILARFEAERQALALMDHPHIARVLDGGMTAAGRPYFVMEYVKGDPITDFADARRLGVRDRLELFAQVCRAVQHAHTKGVIHRDLKPANVLVSMADGRPFAKVIDFGIAKSLASRLTDKTLFTEHRQLIGTPEYMSPEQAEGSPDIDTRTDVYALGVLLYELLTGLTPFDAERLRSAAYGEMQRIIREEDPPTPSARLQRSRATATRPTSAGTPPAPAPRPGAARAEDLRGELDWIVMKALEKDRSRRYQTAGDLAEEIGRHLAGEPVTAAPPSLRYRALKLLRRRRMEAAATAAVLLSLALGLGVAGAFFVRGQRLAVELANDRERAAQAARELAEAERARAEAERAEALRRAALAPYVARLERARELYDARRHDEALAELELCPEPMRGWEWRHLRTINAPVLAIAAHDGPVAAAAISPDAALLASADEGGTVRLWERRTGRPRREMAAPRAVAALRFDEDASRLAAGTDGEVLVWDLASDGEPTRLADAGGVVNALAFSPDGRWLAAFAERAGGAAVARVWDLRRGAPDPLFGADWTLGVRPAHDLRVQAGLLQALDTYKAVSSLRWEGADGPGAAGETREPTLYERAIDRAAPFLPRWTMDREGRWAVRGSSRGTLEVRDGGAHSGNGFDAFTGYLTLPGDVLGVRPLRDGRRLFAVAGAGVYLVDAVTARATLILPRPGDGVPYALSADESRVVVGTEAGVLRSIPLSGDGPERSWAAHAGRIVGLWSGDRSGLLYSAGERGDVAAWDPVSGRLAFRFETGAALREMRASVDERLLVGLTADHRLATWSLPAGEPLHRAPCENGARLALSPDGAIIAVGMPGGFDLFRADGLTPAGRARLGESSIPAWGVFTAEGDRIVSAHADGTLAVWTVDPPERLVLLPTDGTRLTSHTRSEDGDWIVASGGPWAGIWRASPEDPALADERHAFKLATAALQAVLEPAGGALHLLERLRTDPSLPERCREAALVLCADPVMRMALVRSRHVTKERVVAAIEADAAIPPAEREALLREARAWEPTATDLNTAAWGIVATEDATPEMIEAALDGASQALRIAPADDAIRHTLAAALFRAGRLDEAIEILRELTDPARTQPRIRVASVTFLALAHFYQGRVEEARALLHGLRVLKELGALPPNTDTPDWLIRRAEELIGVAPADGPR